MTAAGLTAIKAAAAGLRDPDLPLSDDDRTELAATVEESADRLTAVVDNLLDSSRLANDTVAPQLEPVGYAEAAARALLGVDGSNRVALDLDDPVPDVVADPGLLERVIANVVDNALRHGRGAPVALRASTHADRVELRIVDSGPGLPRDGAERLFAPFQRLDTPPRADRHPVSGVGLGLNVARGFTRAMGGDLVAEDTPGGGLTIVVSLPAAPIAAQHPALRR